MNSALHGFEPNLATQPGKSARSKRGKSGLEIGTRHRIVKRFNNVIKAVARNINCDDECLNYSSIECSHLISINIRSEVCESRLEPRHLDAKVGKRRYLRKIRKWALHDVCTHQSKALGKVVYPSCVINAIGDRSDPSVEMNQRDHRAANCDLTFHKIGSIARTRSLSKLSNWKKHCEEGHRGGGPASQRSDGRPIQAAAWTPFKTRDHYGHCKHALLPPYEFKNSATSGATGAAVNV